VGIGFADSIDFRRSGLEKDPHLDRGTIGLRVGPVALESRAIPGMHTVKLIGRVEDSGICVCDLLGEREQICRTCSE